MGEVEFDLDLQDMLGWIGRKGEKISGGYLA